MDTFNEKKWFVYVGDHHEGPFSVADLQGKLHEGQVNQGSYAWAEGFADWKLMTEIPDFAPIFSSGSEPSRQAQTAFFNEPAVMTITSEIRVAPEDAPKEVKVKAPQGPQRYVIKWALALMVPLVLGILFMSGTLDPLTRKFGPLFQPLAIGLVDKFPALGAYFSPIPHLDDVEEADFELLRQAAQASLDSEGPKVAIVLSKGDIMAPQFYVASNLPDGTIFGMAAVGIPETLLNATQTTIVGEVMLGKKLGKSPALRAPDGKAIPRGNYEVYVWESAKLAPEAETALSRLPPAKTKLPEAAPVGRKLVDRHVYFLGGPKDATYGQRLKEYHDKLKEKATGELTELKMFTSTLDGSLNQTVTEFQRLRTLRNKKLQQKGWNDFHARWSQMDSQLQLSFQKWTPEVLANEYFYPTLYLATQLAGQAVAKVHGIHHAFFTGSIDSKAFDIQQAEALAGARNSLEALNAKIDQAEKIPASANGMPKKDGL